MKFFVLATLASVVASSALYVKPTTYSPSSWSSNQSPTSVESSSPMPFSFKYEVKVDDYTSFGDTRVSDEQGHVSGSYHVQLPDGRHQHVNYKDEGNGYVADVQYNHNPEYSASNVVEYKEKIDNGYKEHRKSPKKNSSKHSGKCTKANCYEESSDEKPIKEQIYTEPVNADRPVALFYHHIPSTTSTQSYKEPIYFNPASYSAPLVKGNGSKTAAQYVSITTEFSADNVVFTYAPEEYGFWQVMHTTPKYLKPTVSTTEKPSYTTTTSHNAPSYTKPPSSHKTPSSTPKISYYPTTFATTTTTKAPTTKAYKAPYPATTSAYKKVIATTLAYNRPTPKNPAVTKKPSITVTPPTHKTPVTSKATTKPVYKTPSTTKTHRIPVYTTPAYRIPVSTTPAYRIPVSTTPAYRKPVSGNVAYKKPLNPTPVYKIPVSTTPKYSTTTPAYKTRYYTTKRNKVASDKAISKKPFAVYKPPSNRVPIKAVDPYVIAPSYNTGKTAHAAPSNVNNIPPYTVILYKPNKQVTQIKN